MGQKCSKLSNFEKGLGVLQYSATETHIPRVPRLFFKFSVKYWSEDMKDIQGEKMQAISITS